jgi:hypothetical protein
MDESTDHMNSVAVTSSGRFLAKLAIAATGVFFALAGGHQAAAAAGPFDGLEGFWNGSGVVTYASGTKEKLRCRVQYILGGSNRLQQALRCASDSYKFQINASFVHNGGSVSGHWDELSMNISGSITGTATAGHINGDLHGPGFLASVSVDTDGDKQSVTIAAADQDIRQVAIEVRKSKR